MHFSIDRTVHTTAFDKPVVDHWLERKIAQTAAGSTEKDRSDDPLPKYEKDGKVTVINALATSAIWNLSNLTEIPN